MAKKAKRKRIVITYAEPTPERMGHGTFAQGGNCATGQDERSGVAYRLIPVIDTMAQTGKLTQRQHYGLARYRDVAIAEERSPMRDSLDKALHGRSCEQGLPPAALRAAIELGRLEDALGSLCDIARAVAVDDATVSQWAVSKGGSPRSRIGGALVTFLGPRRKWLDAAMMDIRMAGERLAASIGA